MIRSAGPGQGLVPWPGLGRLTPIVQTDAWEKGSCEKKRKWLWHWKRTKYVQCVFVHLRCESWEPPPAQTDGEALNPGPWGRGPRSVGGQERRRRRCSDWRGRGVEAQETVSVADCSFDILHVNIQGLLTPSGDIGKHGAELAGHLRIMVRKPEIVCITETWLNRSVAEFQLEGYVTISRRDRADGRCGGGVLVLAATEVAKQVVETSISATAERVWVMMHTDQGPFLLGAWYRPPAPGETDSVNSITDEVEAMAGQAIGTIIVGDMNVHNMRWLAHSSHNSVEGDALQNVCEKVGLRQLVRKPTRGEHLLDLVLSNIDGAATKVGKPVADHCTVLAHVPLALPTSIKVTRLVWRFRDADWELLTEMLADTDWSWLTDLSADDAAAALTDLIINAAEKAIPRHKICENKQSHPWLTDSVLEHIQKKRDAHGQPNEQEAVVACSAAIRTAYDEYVAKTCQELREIKRGSKLWWKKSRELQHRMRACSNIPPLRETGGDWVMEASAKADLFAKTFSDKYTLRDAEENVFSTVVDLPATDHCENDPTAEDAYNILHSLEEDSASGPDLLPTRILKHCAAQLAIPFAMLGHIIMREGRWPKTWTKHWVVPLHKKKTAGNPVNYRGIHLTSQMSKAMERLLACQFMPRQEMTVQFVGPNQFAYLTGHGARDAIVWLATTWISALNARKRIGVYCSDVSGAFDRVRESRMLKKLRSKQINARMILVLASWLRSRVANVVVDGKQSQDMTLANMVFQGTVWGPSLWNIFFGDARDAITEGGYTEAVYADDLNAFKEYDLETSTEEIMSDIDDCQSRLHQWGGANSVEFDDGKESKHIISTVMPEGPSFRLLGIEFDTKLNMGGAVRELVNE